MRKAIFITLILMVMITGGCSQQEPLNPQQSFKTLKKAYQEKNVDLFLSLITVESRRILATNTDIFNELSPESKKEMFARAGLSLDENTPLSVNQYVELYFAHNFQVEKDIVARALDGRIVAVDEGENIVIFTMSTGLDLIFRREAPHWKFDYASVYE